MTAAEKWNRWVKIKSLQWMNPFHRINWNKTEAENEARQNKEKLVKFEAVQNVEQVA